MLNHKMLGRSLAMVVALCSLPLVAHAQPPSLQMLQDRAMIEDIMARYEFALDSGDAEAYGALFAEDGVLANGRSEEKGRAAIVKSVKDLSARFRATAPPAGTPPRKVIHSYSNLVLEVQGDKATAKSNWVEVWNIKAGVPEVGGAGQYNDTLVRKDGKWYFSRREIVGTISAPRAAPAATTAPKPAASN
jgi:hypothetical protein